MANEREDLCESTAPIEDEALENVAGGLSLGGVAATEGAGTVSTDTNRFIADGKAERVQIKENEEKLKKSGQAKATVAKTVKNSKDAAII